MKAKEAAHIIFQAARAGQYPACFPASENRWGATGAEVQGNHLHVTTFTVYVSGADKPPTYREYWFSEAQLAKRLKESPYFPSLLEPVEAAGHTLGHRFD